MSQGLDLRGMKPKEGAPLGRVLQLGRGPRGGSAKRLGETDFRYPSLSKQFLLRNSVGDNRMGGVGPDPTTPSPLIQFCPPSFLLVLTWWRNSSLC